MNHNPLNAIPLDYASALSDCWNTVMSMTLNRMPFRVILSKSGATTALYEPSCVNIKMMFVVVSAPSALKMTN